MHVAVLDVDVGISDTGEVVNASVATHRDIEGYGAAPGTLGLPVYDGNGMPLTLRAAKAMTVATVVAALEHTLSALRRNTTPIAANAPLDSLEVIYLLHKFDRPLGRHSLDLRSIDRNRWSTLTGVAEVLVESMRGLP